MITFFKSRDIESRVKVEPATGQYIGRYRTGLDVLAQSYYQLIASDSVESGSTTTIINATSHVAISGDAIQITSGALQHDTVFVQSVTANTITLSQTLPSALVAAVTFDILRPSLPRVGISGASDVNIAAYGGTVTSLGQKAEAASIPVALATEQDAAKTPSAGAPNSGQYNGIGCYDYFNEVWAPIQDVSVGFGIPGAAVYGDPGVGGVAPVAALNTTPGVGAIGLVTRNIPSGTQAVSIASLPALPANQSVNVAQMNGVAVTMGNGASGTGVQRVTLASDSTGQAKALLYDSAGNAIASATGLPGKSDRGAVVRNIPITARQRDAASGLAEMTIPHGYYSVGNRTSTSGSTTTAIVMTVDPSTITRKGDMLYQVGGTFAQGQGQWATVDSVNATTITLESPGFATAPPTGLSFNIYRPRWLLTDSNGQLSIVASISNTLSTTPVSTNKSFFEAGSLAFGSITNAIASFYTTSNLGYMCEISNTTDVELGYSLDGAASEHFIPADSTAQWNLMDIGSYMDTGTDIQVYYPGPAAPTRGRVSFMLAYY
jgi:hypothetical protein